MGRLLWAPPPWPPRARAITATASMHIPAMINTARLMMRPNAVTILIALTKALVRECSRCLRSERRLYLCALLSKSLGKVNTMVVAVAFIAAPATPTEPSSSLGGISTRSNIKLAPSSPPPTAESNPHNSRVASSTLRPNSEARRAGRMVRWPVRSSFFALRTMLRMRRSRGLEVRGDSSSSFSIVVIVVGGNWCGSAGFYIQPSPVL
mmetsp:Transcript_20568/g.37117  ORF Transcript_20568/g.37117 Transcript_20568/m.37117 type:complete len:208 (-) Transcript_20568:20-643(-)